MVLYAYMRVFVYSRFVENPPICSWETNPPFLRWFCHNKRGEKHSSKISFQMKWNGMAKPWLWKWGSCRYINGGRIFWNGVMHANIIR
jgi:hypothetical protein